jgi:hypothetical protein
VESKPVWRAGDENIQNRAGGNKRCLEKICTVESFTICKCYWGAPIREGERVVARVSHVTEVKCIHCFDVEE